MVDYTRIESVQFEDDDYYYYVKAVPKVTVSDSLRTVKTFSTSEAGGTGFRDQMAKRERARNLKNSGRKPADDGGALQTGRKK